MMRNLLNPKLLLLINTLPIVLLFFLFNGQFEIIRSLLDEESISLWKIFGLVLFVLGLLNFAYTILLILQKKKISVYYGLVALLSYISFIYLFGYHSDKIIPFSIPQWMVSGNLILYVGTFLMPTLAYSLFVIVSHFTTSPKEHKVWKNFVGAFIIPVFWYVFSQIVLPFWQPVNSGFGTHALLIFIIIGTLVFLFFLLRGIYILALSKSNLLKYQLAWKIPISIILPLIGLWINNNNFSGSGIFGDFNSFWFYALAVINGIFICLPNFEKKETKNNISDQKIFLYRVFLFVGRSITFMYTFYFFLVFLPFLPLSVVAIVAVGTGFLMLTPILLFVIHVNELSKDFAYLKRSFSKRLVWLISIVSLSIIPLYITGTYLKDRNVLNETLDYIYTPDYSKNYSIDTESLQSTLYVVKQHKNKRGSEIFGTEIPYLSSYFNWLVLDNLTLSDSKINKIENIFFGTPTYNLRSENIRNKNVSITNITSKSRYDKAQSAWISWVDLEITNDNSTNFSEFATTIELPTGCWINDYYLYVGEKKEMGILAEKKSAMWVFSQIRNKNKDPGILYYLTGNKVAFRVFPFAKKEIRKTGIEFLHKEPIQLSIGGNLVTLGNKEETKTENMETENMIYVSAVQKHTLQKVKRTPYFHFIVDVSKNSDITKITDRIEHVIKNNPLSKNAKISFVNSYVKTTELDKEWKQKLESYKLEGGFYLDRAVKKTLVDAYKEEDTKKYPVMVVVTDSIQKAVLNKDFSDFKITFPENNVFYSLKRDGKLEPHSLTENISEKLTDTTSYSFEHTVLEYKNNNKTYYIPKNNNPSIILKNNITRISETKIKANNWATGLDLQGMWLSQILHPETSNTEWLNLVKYSFKSTIMTPLTSYLVVENEAQKAILKKKQEQVLSGNKSLDLGEDAQRMSEPNTIVMIVILSLVLLYRKKRKIIKLNIKK